MFKRLSIQGDENMSINKKIVVFLIGIMILGKIGGSVVEVFSVIGDLAFFALIVFFGYLLFKKLFMK